MIGKNFGTSILYLKMITLKGMKQIMMMMNEIFYLLVFNNKVIYEKSGSLILNITPKRVARIILYRVICYADLDPVA